MFIQVDNKIIYIIVIGILFSFLSQNINYLLISLCIIIYIYCISNNNNITDKNIIENITNYTKNRFIDRGGNNKCDNKIKKIIKPTKLNPFMNILPTDYNKRIDTLTEFSDPNISFSQINDNINNKFNIGLYRDINSNENSQRQFYTTPITTIPNKQSQFANWLYN